MTSHSSAVELQRYSVFYLEARNGWVVRTTARPLYLSGMTTHPFYRRQVGFQGRSGRARKISRPNGIRSSKQRNGVLLSKVQIVTCRERPEWEKWYTSSSTLSLNWALDRVGSQRHAPAVLPPKRPGTNCIGGWLRPRAVLDGWWKIRSQRDSISGPSSP